MMKNIAILVLAGMPVFGFSQLRIGILAGIQDGHSSLKKYNYVLDQDNSNTNNLDIVGEVSLNSYSRISLMGGLKANASLNGSISVSTELFLNNFSFGEHVSEKFIGTTSLDSVKGRDITRLLYLTLPVHLQFYTSIGKYARLYIGVGGYISYGLAGSDEFDKTISSIPGVVDSITQITFSSSPKIRSATYHANRIDYGASVMGGLEFRNNIFLELAYDNGLGPVFKDRFPVRDTEGKIYYQYPGHKRAFRLSIGYYFK